MLLVILALARLVELVQLEVWAKFWVLFELALLCELSCVLYRSQCLLGDLAGIALRFGFRQIFFNFRDLIISSQKNFEFELWSCSTEVWMVS